VGNCSRALVAAQNRSVIFREYLACCPPAKRPARAEGAEAPGTSCACWGQESANETDYLDATQMEMQWGKAGEEEESCPLNCPTVEKAHTSVKS
jgi:hypothetical protein